MDQQMLLRDTYESKKCVFCTQTSSEKTFILKSIEKSVKLLKEKSQIRQFSYDSDKSGFIQLVRIVFGIKYCQVKEVVPCQHKKYEKILCWKTKLKVPQFRSICSKLADRNAERSYQLEVLENQVKNVSKALSQEKENVMHKKFFKRNSLTRVQDDQRQGNRSEEVEFPTEHHLEEPAVNNFMGSVGQPNYYIGVDQKEQIQAERYYFSSYPSNYPYSYPSFFKN